MSTIRLEQLAGNDADLKAALTDARLPTDDIEDDSRTFFKALSSDGRIVGFSGVQRCAENSLLRSGVVLPDRRGEGFGRAVVKETLASLATTAMSSSQRRARPPSLRALDSSRSSGTACPQQCGQRASFPPSVHRPRPS